MATLTHEQMNKIRNFLFADPISIEAFKRLYYFLNKSVDGVRLDYRTNKNDMILGVKRDGERLRFYLIRQYNDRIISIRFVDPEISPEVFNPLKLDEYKANLISISDKIKAGTLDLKIKTSHAHGGKYETPKSDESKALAQKSTSTPHVKYNLRPRSKTISGHYHPDKENVPKNFEFIKKEVGTLSDNANDVQVTIKIKISDIEQLNTDAISKLLIKGAELNSIDFCQKKKN